MTTAGRAYVVRDASAGTGPGTVTQVYAYTLQGLTTALEDACHRSITGAPQILAVMAEGKSTIIRRFEDGHEAPLTPLSGDGEPRWPRPPRRRSPGPWRPCR